MDAAAVRRALEEERRRLLALAAGLSEREAEGGGRPLSAADQHPADAGSDTFEREKELAVLQQLRAQIADVEAALRKLEGGTYGRCELCGREIDPVRLEARPAARFCLADQARVERSAASGVGLS
ncbi:MAG TPA: TraR/DksA C4-type zinc finger protein [Actinomycetota bacterium]|nr:TraR/DksA C4-type zinc finger protein [Actinomycetota bacterium]